jgi:hypothetical protein
MRVAPYVPDAESFRLRLLPLIDRLYPDAHDVFRHGHRSAHDYCVENPAVDLCPLTVQDGAATVGHVALVRDGRLPPGEAFFGFLELVDDPAVFDALWRGLIDLARSCGTRRLLGPVNGSIWHAYRCVRETSAMPWFPTEPRTPLSFYRFLKSAGPSREIGYSSGLRQSFARMLALMEDKAETIEPLMQAQGFAMSVAQGVPPEAWPEIVALSDAVFRPRSWGYTPLGTAEFMRLHGGLAQSPHFHRVFLLRLRGRLIGYALTLRMGATMICKTICLMPEFQGMGLGNAFALYLHRAARQDGMTSIMYVLVRDGNRIHDFPMEDIAIFRRYAAFEFDL